MICKLESRYAKQYESSFLGSSLALFVPLLAFGRRRQVLMVTVLRTWVEIGRFASVQAIALST